MLPYIVPGGFMETSDISIHLSPAMLYSQFYNVKIRFYQKSNVSLKETIKKVMVTFDFFFHKD